MYAEGDEDYYLMLIGDSDVMTYWGHQAPGIKITPEEAAEFLKNIRGRLLF